MIDAYKYAGNLLQSMITGYGPKLRPLKDLFALKLTDEDIARQKSPIPALGRYKGSVSFMEDVTSARSIGRKRFMVLICYFKALSKLMAGYDGGHRPISGKLSGSEIKYLNSLGARPEEIRMAEEVEKVSEHDTAAAGDYLKLRILYDYIIRGKKFLTYLCRKIEAFNFATTSEDLMSIVFGIIANELVYVHFMRKLLDLMEFLIRFAKKFPGFLYLPESTHDQFAEPTTYGKKIANTLEAISQIIREDLIRHNCYKVFTGKFTGATGGLVTHNAAYADIDWRAFNKKFVQSFGLHPEEMTFQCVTYAREAQIFRTLMTISDQLCKLLEDFIKMASAPAHFFQKIKKPGAKGSSVMPKVNLWYTEGAIIMLEEFQHMLGFLAEKLQRFPHAGNMKRSYLMRNLGNYFMPFFIAVDRIMKEMDGCVANSKKIEEAFRKFPGMSGSAIQTVLKRAGIPDDAYRIVQEAAVNSDGSYNEYDEFLRILKEKMDGMKLYAPLQKQIIALMDYKLLAEPGRKMAEEYFAKLELDFAEYRERTYKIKTF
jgi:adenylosuccinate lyase